MQEASAVLHSFSTQLLLLLLIMMLLLVILNTYSYWYFECPLTVSSSFIQCKSYVFSAV